MFSYVFQPGDPVKPVQGEGEYKMLNGANVLLCFAMFSYVFGMFCYASLLATENLCSCGGLVGYRRNQQTYKRHSKNIAKHSKNIAKHTKNIAKHTYASENPTVYTVTNISEENA